MHIDPETYREASCVAVEGSSIFACSSHRIVRKEMFAVYPGRRSLPDGNDDCHPILRKRNDSVHESTTLFQRK